MIGQRLKLARAAAGLSLRELEERLGNQVTAQAISKYEQERMMPSSPVLRALAGALDVSVSYLLSPVDLVLDDVEFRRDELAAKDHARVEAAVVDRLQRYLTIEEALAAPSSNWSRPEGAPFPVNDLADAELAAARVRAAWQLGLDPLPNVSEFLEEKGVKVLSISLPEKVDGLCCKVSWRERQRIPVVIVNAHPYVSGERARFTLAHELGHLVLECSDNVNLEKAAHRFAGAFLMPAEVLWREVGRKRTSVSIAELKALKRIFGVSIHMITMRCRELGIFSADLAADLFRQYRELGWRNPPDFEPGRLEREDSNRFERLCYRAVAEGVISESKAAELLGKTIRDLEHVMSSR